jgi:hypothetical protein
LDVVFAFGVFRAAFGHAEAGVDRDEADVEQYRLVGEVFTEPLDDFQAYFFAGVVEEDCKLFAAVSADKILAAQA